MFGGLSAGGSCLFLSMAGAEGDSSVLAVHLSPAARCAPVPWQEHALRHSLQNPRLSDPAISCLLLVGVRARGVPERARCAEGTRFSPSQPCREKLEFSAAVNPGLFGSVLPQGGQWEDCSEHLWLWSWRVAVGVGTGGCLARQFGCRKGNLNWAWGLGSRVVYGSCQWLLLLAGPFPCSRGTCFFAVTWNGFSPEQGLAFMDCAGAGLENYFPFLSVRFLFLISMGDGCFN